MQMVYFILFIFNDIALWRFEIQKYIDLASVTMISFELKLPI